VVFKTFDAEKFFADRCCIAPGEPYLISRGSSLPFVLIFLGVVGGILAFGFNGSSGARDTGEIVASSGQDVKVWPRKRPAKS